MLPLSFLAVMVALTGVSFVIDLAIRQRRTTSLRRLAAHWQMNYSASDPFHLLPRVAEHFLVPGASSLRLCDLIYRQEADWYRYLFTVEYTVGVIGPKRRLRRAASLSEPRDHQHGAHGSILQTAPDNLPLIHQYIRLHVALLPRG